MEKAKDIKVLQLGPTTRCNGKCKYCPHNKWKIPNMDLDPKVFDNLPIETLEKLFFAGLSGDPMMYKPLFDVLERRIERNNDIKITIATNGSANDESWWADLAQIISNNYKNHVYFAVDGLEDTHCIYRGTDYKKILKNMNAFIKAGGNAIWQTIAFKYNEHQIDEIKKRAADIGSKFILKMSRVYDETGEFSKPTFVRYNGRKDLNSKAKLSGSKINCYYVHQKQVWIDADGIAHPCCFLYSPILSGKINQFPWTYQLNYNKSLIHEGIDLNHHTLDEALNSSYFRYVRENFKSKIHMCDQTCRTRWEDMIETLPDGWINKPLYKSFKKRTLEDLDNIRELTDDDTARRMFSVSDMRPEFAFFDQSFSPQQIKDKNWIIDELNKIIDHPVRIAVVGAWHGLLPYLLHKKFKHVSGDIVSIDMDKSCAPIAEALNDGLPTRVETANAFGYDYSKFDLVINTSCEHMDFQSWLSEVKGKLVVLQSNNANDVPEHINCVENFLEFETKAQLTDVFYMGSRTKDFTDRERFMLIGRK